MSVRIFINEGTVGKASVAQVASRLPRTVIGRSSREENILDLMDSVAVVPFLSASGAVVGRGTVGPGFDIVEAELEGGGSKRKRQRILDFFNYVSPMQSNVKDIYSSLAKIYTTAFSFRIFGHAAWEVIRDKATGAPLGFDVIPGVIKPNIEPDGKFKSPAYIQYLRVSGVESKSEFRKPEDVIFFAVPDYGGGVYMAELLSLSEYTLPSEIYAAIAYRSMHENRDAPYSGFWYTPNDIDDSTFNRFVAMVNSRYTGADNYGRNPIIMKGEGGFKPVASVKDDAPYVEGRELNRNEISASTGVPSAKYGIESSSDMRELRREFYESTLRPMMALLEEAIYVNVCIRLFDAPEWKFKFKRPDFTTAIEDASIELRRIQWGQWSPNEARASRGEAPREYGDYYLIPKNMDMIGEDGKPGRPENEPVDNDEGDMKPSEEDPIPDTQPPEQPQVNESALVSELRKWRKFAIRVASGRRFRRAFVPSIVPEPLSDYIFDVLEQLDDDPVMVTAFFDELLEAV